MHFSVANCERKRESLNFSREFCPRLLLDGKLYRCMKHWGTLDRSTSTTTSTSFPF